MDFLKYEYPGIFVHICSVRGISIQPYLDFCKRCKYGPPEVYVLYIHGRLFQQYLQSKSEKKLTHGVKDIIIGGVKYSYTGEMDENGKAHG